MSVMGHSLTTTEKGSLLETALSVARWVYRIVLWYNYCMCAALDNVGRRPCWSQDPGQHTSERALACLHNGLHKVFLAVPIRCQKVLFQVTPPYLRLCGCVTEYTIFARWYSRAEPADYCQFIHYTLWLSFADCVSVFLCPPVDRQSTGFLFINFFPWTSSFLSLLTPIAMTCH